MARKRKPAKSQIYLRAAAQRQAELDALRAQKLREDIELVIARRGKLGEHAIDALSPKDHQRWLAGRIAEVVEGRKD